MHATDLVFGLMFFSVVLYGMGSFAIGTMTEYGAASDESDFQDLVTTSQTITSTTHSMKTTIESERLDSTNVLGIVYSIGTMAWEALKLMFGMINTFTRLPAQILPVLGLTGVEWVIDYIVAGVTMVVVLMLLEANTGVKLK